jgi:hypothetical protein
MIAAICAWSALPSAISVRKAQPNPWQMTTRNAQHGGDRRVDPVRDSGAAGHQQRHEHHRESAHVHLPDATVGEFTNGG